MPEAIALFQRALGIRTHSLGDQNVETLNSAFRLGWTLYIADETEEGQAIMTRALSALADALGNDHPDVLRLRTLSTGTMEMEPAAINESIDVRQPDGPITPSPSGG